MGCIGIYGGHREDQGRRWGILLKTDIVHGFLKVWRFIVRFDDLKKNYTSLLYCGAFQRECISF